MAEHKKETENTMLVASDIMCIRQEQKTLRNDKTCKFHSFKLSMIKTRPDTGTG